MNLTEKQYDCANPIFKFGKGNESLNGKICVKVSNTKVSCPFIDCWGDRGNITFEQDARYNIVVRRE